MKNKLNPFTPLSNLHLTSSYSIATELKHSNASLLWVFAMGSWPRYFTQHTLTPIHLFSILLFEREGGGFVSYSPAYQPKQPHSNNDEVFLNYSNTN